MSLSVWVLFFIALTNATAIKVMCGIRFMYGHTRGTERPDWVGSTLRYTTQWPILTRPRPLRTSFRTKHEASPTPNFLPLHLLCQLWMSRREEEEVSFRLRKNLCSHICHGPDFFQHRNRILTLPRGASDGVGTICSVRQMGGCIRVTKLLSRANVFLQTRIVMMRGLNVKSRDLLVRSLAPESRFCSLRSEIQLQLYVTEENIWSGASKRGIFGRDLLSLRFSHS